AKALAESLRANGLDIVSGGTDNHLMLVDLRPKGLKGNASEKALVRAAITCNKNGIPFDPETPFVTSGLRLGTPAATTRGFGVAEFQQVGGMSAEALNALAQRPAGAVRPRQAGALVADLLAQEAGRCRTRRKNGLGHRARARERWRGRGFLGGDRRDRDGASAPARRRRLCPLRLGLPQLPRSEG